MAFHVYFVRASVPVGVPLTERPERVTPLGSAGLNEYVSVPSPPVACGRVNEDMREFRVHDLSLIVVLNLGLRSGGVTVGGGGTVGTGGSTGSSEIVKSIVCVSFVS